MTQKEEHTQIPRGADATTQGLPFADRRYMQGLMQQVRDHEGQLLKGSGDKKKTTPTEQK